MPPEQTNTGVKCPKCGFGNVPCHSDLDRRLENDEAIPMVCFALRCEHKWELSAQDKLSLVRFLFGHRAPTMSLREWLSEFEKTCLRATLTTERTLRDEAEALAILTKASVKGSKLEEFSVALFGGQSGAPDHLNLITLHSAKGMEFDVVIMMGIEQGRIPSWAAKTDESKRKPRRLFCVGLTRARHEVHMTFSGFNVDRYDRRHENGPSEFLIEVAQRMKESPQK